MKMKKVTFLKLALLDVPPTKKEFRTLNKKIISCPLGQLIYIVIVIGS